MAQVTMTICDRHHQQGAEVPGTSRRFVIDGFKATTDLCDECYETEAGPLLSFLRTMTGTTAPKRTTTSGKRRPKSKLDSSTVRAWAVENGIDVSPRGRISQDLLERYRASQG
ncbi:Lsr2 family DNA-binding protein [Nocardioides ungokensis]|uniref:Lsr2 family DNA-binding protein n=1 Tax=Nocardioides ungokensis TaxID=1643322 RepID=UPI0015DF697F|nr:histone-like nucleoid-structuring protein Lsr2 [Nocardioides ungokensis]